jgi:hypothetical protein
MTTMVTQAATIRAVVASGPETDSPPVAERRLQLARSETQELEERIRRFAGLLKPRGDVHSLMKNSDDVNDSGVGETVEQKVRPNGQLQISGPDVINGPPFSAFVGHGLTGIGDFPDVAFGLLDAPPVGGVVPNIREVGAGCR